jgi:hypothetical protein
VDHDHDHRHPDQKFSLKNPSFFRPACVPETCHKVINFL